MSEYVSMNLILNEYNKLKKPRRRLCVKDLVQTTVNQCFHNADMFDIILLFVTI